MRTTEQSRFGWYFLISVLIMFAIAIYFNPNALIPTLKFTYSLVIQLVPVFILVFILLAAFDFFVTPKILAEYIGKKSGIKGWLIAIITGIISTGPIYMWYPLLNELQKQGVRTGFLATFLYNRAVKPALIPVMIVYFGLKFVVVLTIVMIIVSVFQGIIVENIVEVKV